MNRLRFAKFIFLSLLIGFSKFAEPDYYFTIEEPPAEIIGKEDLMGRLEYEQLIQADPKTGKIPDGIRTAELAFNERLLSKTKNLRTNDLEIQSAGPFNVGGRTRAVAFDIRDENIIVAGGVSGGIWKSTDGGQSWIRKSNPLNRNSVTCIVQDTRPGKENIWYHGTGEIIGNSANIGGDTFRGTGIYKSVDNGESWTLLSSTSNAEPNRFSNQFQFVFRIIVNKFNFEQDEVFAATFGGILRSIDGGQSWESVIGPKQFDLPDSVNLGEFPSSVFTEISQANNGIFYAGLSTATLGSANLDRSPNAGIYVSQDGINWEDITPFTQESTYRRIVIGNSESDPNISYFLIDSNPIFLLRLFLRFEGNTLVRNFDLRETPNFGGDLGNFDTQSSYNMMIRVHPENPDIVFAGGTNLYRSTDGFESSENSKWIGGYTPEGGATVYPGHHPDQHDLLFYPSDPNRMLSASDGGLRISQDGTADSVMWQSLNNGFITSQFFTIAQSKEAGDPILIGGMQDNGTDVSRVAGLSDWEGIISGDGGYAATTPGNELWFASFQRGQTLRLTFNEDFRTTSFARVDPAGLVAESGSSYLFINPFALDPGNSNRMFIAGGNHLYFNANISQIPGGSQVPSSLGWERITENIDAIGSISTVDVSMDSEIVYFGTSSGQLYKLINASMISTKFSVEQLSDPEFPQEAYIACVAINPEDSEHIVIVFSNYNVPSIFESKDGGITFTDISGNLEQNEDGSGNGPSIRWAEIIPTNTRNLYLVGSSIGLSSTTTTNGKSTVWVKESENLIGNSVIPMMDYRANDGRLAIATHGNGVFTTTIQDFKRINLEEEDLNFTISFASPNPFNEKTKIQYTIPEAGTVKIDVYDLGGELITNLLWAPQFAGTNEITWDGTNTSGTSLANGVYLYRVRYSDQSLTGKLILRR